MTWPEIRPCPQPKTRPAVVNVRVVIVMNRDRI